MDLIVNIWFSAGRTALHIQSNCKKTKTKWRGGNCAAFQCRWKKKRQCGRLEQGSTWARAGEACRRGARRGKGLQMSPLPPRPLCLTDEFKQEMVIACLQHSPNHKSLCKKNGKAIRWVWVCVCVCEREKKRNLKGNQIMREHVKHISALRACERRGACAYAGK